MSTLYNALLQLTPEELVTVLDEIISCKLGIPKDVANNLAESFKEQDVKVNKFVSKNGSTRTCFLKIFFVRNFKRTLNQRLTMALPLRIIFEERSFGFL